MTNSQLKFSKNKISEIKDFAWNSVELFVSNSQKETNIIIKLAGNLNIRRTHVLYFRVEKKNIYKKRSKVKNVPLSRSKFVELYQKLDQVRLRSIIPSGDYGFFGVQTRLGIIRGNSQINISWIYNTQSKWKRLDDIILFVLGLCGEKRMLNFKLYRIPKNV